MTDTVSRSLRSVMPHEAMTASRAAFTHGMSEISNDPNVIMPTVTQWDQHFAWLEATPEGGLQLDTYASMEEVRKFYEYRCGLEELVGGHGTNQLSAPWYQVVEVIAEYRTRSTAELRMPHVAVLFACWPDGIIGEIFWERPAWAQMPTDWRFEAELAARLDRLEAGWRANDIDAKLAEFEDDTRGAMRIVEVDGDRRSRLVAQNKDELKSLWSTPEFGRVVELERMTRFVTNFYVFASWRMILELPSGTVERELAAIYPVGPNGAFCGELGYAFETRLDN